MIEEIKRQWEADEPYYRLRCPYCGEEMPFCDGDSDWYENGIHMFKWNYSCCCGERWAIVYKLHSPVFEEL